MKSLFEWSDFSELREDMGIPLTLTQQPFHMNSMEISEMILAAVETFFHTCIITVVLNKLKMWCDFNFPTYKMSDDSNIVYISPMMLCEKEKIEM